MNGAVTEIRISDHQYALIKQAVQPGNADLVVYGIKNTSHRTFRALYRAGLVDRPGYGARLTETGQDVARQLKKDRHQRKFLVPLDVLPKDAA